ncbi:MAG TPA: ABC transporter permease [Streptosporangiaceae bacterium]|jgi:ABC-2 type transport system permease protein|nr:ABC transporter permease [Streptosporangiaceae bacterium]
MSGIFNGTVASITLRATLGRRRALLFGLPAAILILVTLALKASHPSTADWPSLILGDFGFTVVIPLTALVVGGSVLGAEIDDGSIIHLLATPVRRSSVIMTKFAVATGLTMVFAAGSELVAGLIATGSATKLVMALFAGALVGSLIYNALFIMLSAATTRAIAVGLLYVLVWEGLLGNFVSGVRILSIGHYALGVANAIAHDSSLHAGLSLTTAVVMGAIVTVAALLMAMQRLASFSLRGDAV